MRRWAAVPVSERVATTSDVIVAAVVALGVEYGAAGLQFGVDVD